MMGLRVTGWNRWVIARLFSGLAAIVAISLLVFVATLVLPSDPARSVLGADASEEAVVQLRSKLGLDRPILVQYGGWAGRTLQGDLGNSIDSGAAVAELIAPRAANSLYLMLCVLIAAIPLSFVAGLSLASRRDRPADRAAMTLLVLLKAVPGFIIALALMLLLSTSVLHLLPAVSLLDPAHPAIVQPAYVALPGMTLLLGVVPLLTRLIRTTAIEAQGADFVIAARLRGVPERTIRWRYIAPSTFAATIQGIAMSARALFGGVMVVEVVFGYPGLGSLLNSAVEVRDLPVIQGLAIVTAIAVVVINLAADAVTVLLTPKLRTSRQPSLRPGARAQFKLAARMP